MHFLISLALTLLVELPLALVWGLRGRDLILVALVNCLTNPLVVLVHGWLGTCGVLVHTVLPELWAVGTEALVYVCKGHSIPRPAVFAVSVNLLSFGLGLAVQF